jgi:uncharacterized protein YjbI with pentapeptide repeats
MPFNREKGSMSTSEQSATAAAIPLPPPTFSRHEICCGLTCKDLLNVVVHLFLPLSLGVFTIVITLHQQNISTIQRLEDREWARNQRDQDLNNSAQQREQDKLTAKLQREEDQLRRLQDLNISALQRDLDLQIAATKNRADDLNAEKQRIMSQEQRYHEMEVEKFRYDQERDKYLDELVLSYINEIGQLLKENNGLLTRNNVSAALARAKTLNVAGQLDPPRSAQLVQFLYNAEQLTVGHFPLDLTGAALNGIMLSPSARLLPMKKMCLAGALLINASFADQDISDWDFTGAQLTGASFIRCTCNRTKFNRATLVRADFSHAILHRTQFVHADMSLATFYQILPDDFVFFNLTKLTAANFTDAHFSGTAIHQRFRQCNLVGSIFRDVRLYRSKVELCNLTQADFTQVSDSRNKLCYFHTVVLISSSDFPKKTMHSSLQKTFVLSQGLSRVLKI